MEITDNELDGETVILVAGDKLSEVPKSHRHLITPTVRKVFADPSKYFQETAARCKFPKMAQWLKAVTKGDGWELHLDRAQPGGSEWIENVVFCLWGHEIMGAEIGIPENRDLSNFPPDIQHYYSLVDVVSSNGFGVAGSLSGVDGVEPFKFSALVETLQSSVKIPINLDETVVWGGAPDGHIYAFFTLKGQSGLYDICSGRFKLLGSISQAIDFMFSRMLKGKHPIPDEGE